MGWLLLSIDAEGRALLVNRKWVPAPPHAPPHSLAPTGRSALGWLRAPALSGHKDGLVAVFFTGPATRQAALVEGRRLPVLCTLSRDGALFHLDLHTLNGTAGASSEGRTGGAAGPRGGGSGSGQQQAQGGGVEAEEGEEQGEEEEGEGDPAADTGYLLAPEGGEAGGEAAAGLPAGHHREGPGPGHGAVAVLGTGPQPKKQRLASGKAGKAAAAACQAGHWHSGCGGAGGRGRGHQCTGEAARHPEPHPTPPHPTPPHPTPPHPTPPPPHPTPPHPTPPHPTHPTPPHPTPPHPTPPHPTPTPPHPTPPHPTPPHPTPPHPTPTPPHPTPPHPTHPTPPHPTPPHHCSQVMPFLAGGAWSLGAKDYLNQRGARTLSISREKISALAWNPSGDWLAGQAVPSVKWLLLRHLHRPHSTSDAVSFLPSGHALVSASLDGTVRAFDLVSSTLPLPPPWLGSGSSLLPGYRNFRTMTSPSPVQFVCVAVDAGGEVVAAGTADSFQIYVWSLRTGRLLDVLAGHEGPDLGCILRWWHSGGATALPDVLALAFRPDGKQLAVATLSGGHHPHTIEGRRDIKGGRLSSDRRAAGNLASGASFTSLAYSADGAFLTAGGSSRYVVIYDVAERVMLRRFAVTSNRSLDGVLDMLNSKHLTDAGPLQLIDAEGPDADDAELLPPMLDAAAAADVPGAGKGKRPSARTRSLALSPTGRCWAAATTEGVVLYSLDDDMLFDPTDLSEDLTPATCRKALAAGAHLRALLIALRLRDSQLLRACVFGTPAAQVVSVAAGLPAVFLPPLVQALAQYITSSPHLEFVLKWAHALCTQHGSVLEAAAGGAGRNATVAAAALPSLRLLQKALSQMHEDLSASCESNLYTLEYLLAAGSGAVKGASSNQAGDNAVDKQAKPHDTKPGDATDVRAEQSSSDNDDSDVVPLVSVGRIGGAAAEGRSSSLLGLDAGQEDEHGEADGAANDEAGCMPGWG
ncbi:hypothetical protein QJQ45_000793 [Haematococcus lacustris]|nr:hypothetical protein QJQ45_000793 [Haematococcus lacustris]